MTDSAQEFIGTATFAAITGFNPVTSLFGDENVSPHTSLGQWAEVIVIAPATASTISKLAAGQSSDALTATVMATTAPTIIAPAMHTEMWEQPAVTANIQRLTDHGYTIIGPETGALAGGDIGIGRLAEPETIADAIETVLPARDMAGLTVLITAGGTREPVDPVRFIGNRSTGKMGNALVDVADERGATVLLVTTVEPPALDAIEVIRVETADEMASAVWSRSGSVDIAVLAAAVSDFKPLDPSDTKIRRTAGVPEIELVPTPDILKGVHESSPRPFLVGFAAETGSVEGAGAKATAKGVDLLVANDVTKPGSGFGTDTNEVRLVLANGDIKDLDLMSKRDVASTIWDMVMQLRTES